MAEVVFQCDADDADVRVHRGVAVLDLHCSAGRVLVSLTRDLLDRLALRIQMEQAQHPEKRNGTTGLKSPDDEWQGIED